MPIHTSPPLPFLPTEVKKEILKFCDQPTLAKTSTLSLAFLQLSSPLLYRHIEFEGPEGLTKFLTIVAEKRHPELDPWLDLSLVHSVTYIEDQEDPFNPTDEEESIEPLCLHLVPSSSSPGRLPVQSLKVVLSSSFSLTQVNPFFDPVEFELNGLRDIPGGEVPSSSVTLSFWTRLRKLVFVNAFFYDYLMSCLEERLKAGLVDGLEIFYDLSRSVYTDVQSWVEEDLNVSTFRSIEKVAVLVNTSEERRLLLESLTSSVLLPRITVLVKSSTETASHAISST